MSMYEKMHLKCMSITIEELGNKHQLNPNNNGVTRIDDCLAYSKGSGIFRCDLLGIRQNGLNNTQLVELKCGEDTIRVIVAVDTQLLSDNEQYVSIKDGTLKLGTNLVVVSGKTVLKYSVTQITVNNSAYTYNIKTSRKNYVLECGLVVKSD